jgi:rhodanese-related sulfurtransferase
MRPAHAVLFALTGSLLWAFPVHAQPTPENLCIQQVGEQYQALVKESDATGLAGGADTAWDQQLAAIVSQVRQNMTLAQIESNQGNLAKRNVVQLLEQLRRSNDAANALRKALEQTSKALEQTKGGNGGDASPKN